MRNGKEMISLAEVVNHHAPKSRIKLDAAPVSLGRNYESIARSGAAAPAAAALASSNSRCSRQKRDHDS